MAPPCKPRFESKVQREIVGAPPLLEIAPPDSAATLPTNEESLITGLPPLLSMAAPKRIELLLLNRQPEMAGAAVTFLISPLVLSRNTQSTNSGFPLE